MRTTTPPLLVAALFLLAGCTSVPITPAAIRTAPVPPEETAALLDRWETAVVIANEFLASPFRLTLPAGAITLEDDGMSFRSGEETWPIRVRHDAIGQACTTLGFVAQERADGFAVGRVPPRRSTAVDNTFFRSRQGGELRPEAIAGLILHEATHQILRDGTVNVPKSVAYYAEAVLFVRYRTHSAERRPYATSEEFQRFLQSHGQDAATQERMWREFEEHLAQGPTRFCRHGP